jgi:hypothetical protein
MVTKLLKLEELEEGEYEAPFGRVVVSRTDRGYRIEVYINEKELGRNAVKHLLKSFLTPALGGGKQV